MLKDPARFPLYQSQLCARIYKKKGQIETQDFFAQRTSEQIIRKKADKATCPIEVKKWKHQGHNLPNLLV
jgi:hypothetical protein